MYYLNSAFEPSFTRELYEFPEYYEPYRYSFVSRYGNTRMILDKSNGTYHHETVSNYVVKPCKEDSYITITENTNRRLDVLSCAFYNTPSYWWIIALANNIQDAFEEIPVGTVLRIPQLASIYTKGNVASSKRG